MCSIKHSPPKSLSFSHFTFDTLVHSVQSKSETGWWQAIPGPPWLPSPLLLNSVILYWLTPCRSCCGWGTVHHPPQVTVVHNKLTLVQMHSLVLLRWMHVTQNFSSNLKKNSGMDIPSCRTTWTVWEESQRQYVFSVSPHPRTVLEVVPPPQLSW